jgi:hypothetical protein
MLIIPVKQHLAGRGDIHHPDRRDSRLPERVVTPLRKDGCSTRKAIVFSIALREKSKRLQPLRKDSGPKGALVARFGKGTAR